MDTTVKFFQSTMSGAPALSGTVGSLISVIDACLVNGFGAVTLDSLVISSNVATGTVSAGHNFAINGTTGPVIAIYGATPSALNGEWRVASVPNSTTFTFSTSGISNQTATGTIVAKRAPAGWAKIYSGTNKAVYQCLDLTSTRLCLRVDDVTNAQWGYLTGYESMTDVDTGINSFPSTPVYFAKSSAASSTTRAWNVIADHKLAFIFAQADGTNWYGYGVFGDVITYALVDIYHCILAAHGSTVQTNNSVVNFSQATQSGQYFARAYDQITKSIGFGKVSLSGMSSLGNNSILTQYPNRPNNAFMGMPIYLFENNGVDLRGVMPGMICPILHYTNIAQGAIVTVLSGFSTPRDLFIQSHHTNNQYRSAIDITGPWR